MRKIIATAGKIFMLLVISINGFSQAETFDIITYTPPKDWKKDTKQGVVNYTYVNTTTGTFCVIAIYASTASFGDAQKDFKKGWKELVITPYKAQANPTTETETTPDGWEAVTGVVLVKLDGTDVYVILTVISGFGKTVTVRCSLNDQSYSSEIDALFQTMKLDQTKKSTVNTTIVAPVQTNNSTGKFGAMIYSKPAGWSEQIFSDGVVFKPSGLLAGDLLAMQLMQPLNFSGSLEQALSKSFSEATAMYNGSSMYQADGAYGKNAAQKSFNGWEYIRGKGSIRVASGEERGLELFVVKINNRFERIAILESRNYCGGVSRYFASERLSYRNGIENLLYSLKFSDFNAPVLKSGSANGTGVTGVWEGTIQSTGAATGVRLEAFTPIFFDNGQVYFGNKFPTEGLDELNSRIPPELYPRNWGTYTFSNASGVLQMPFANILFRIQGDKLIVTKNQRDWPFYKLKRVDGAKFSGTYKMSESYEIIPEISFTSDGKFTDKGVIRTLIHEGTTCINEGYAPGSGTYEVKNHTVIFKYTDGRKIKVAFLGTDYDKSNPSPATIRMGFNDDPMTRQ